MHDPKDEIVTRHEAAISCGCCCEDFATFAEQRKPEGDSKTTEDRERLPDSAASRRGSVRYVFEQLRGALSRKR
ncbi:hypothetical protein [Ruegeria sp.]|uniref:hypothetical protein n=1 Tax=Ruegeria sp. TaxID=1879320 RepID=UPI002318FCDC|nr:hypothetical protein [Ruegeria sp.]MDA7964440.1 hypothetical protein [Ruegeria sp.]